MIGFEASFLLYKSFKILFSFEIQLRLRIFFEFQCIPMSLRVVFREFNCEAKLPSNGIESGHNQFASDIAIKQPTVYKLITAMQKEQKNVRVRLCQIQAGDLNEDKTSR